LVYTYFPKQASLPPIPIVYIVSVTVLLLSLLLLLDTSPTH